jgi:hypothetical protein
MGKYDYKCILVVMYSAHHSCQMLMKSEFCWHDFKKYPNIKFHEISSSGSQVVPCGQSDGQADISKLIVTSCNFANVPKNQQLSFPVPFRSQISVNVLGHRNVGWVYGTAVPALQNHKTNKAYGKAGVLLYAFIILPEYVAE